ncbi:MAG: hypothetical protein ACTTHG_07555 [Treponemataceae bacterium]
MLKKICYATAIVLLAFAVFGCNGIDGVNSRASVTWTTSPELYAYVKSNYNGNSEEDGLIGSWLALKRTDIDEPISIAECVLKDQKGKRHNAYVVALSGTELVFGQSTGVLTDLLSGFEFDNCYFRNVCKAIKSTVPAGSKLILAGHSLGGMISQQIAADYDIKKNYDVLNTICFGSPLLAAGSREGVVKRLGDTSDIVPYLSGRLFTNTLWAIMGLNRENGGYGLKSISAHNNSYGRDDVWGAYDILGYKHGKARLTIYTDTVKYFANPVF